MPEMIRDCGSTAHAVIAVSALAFVVAVVAVVLSALRWKHARVGAIVALVVSVGPFVAGTVGTLRGRQAVDRALANVAASPGMRQRLQRRGYSQVQRCTRAGMTLGGLPVVLSAGAMLLGFALNERRPSDPD